MPQTKLKYQVNKLDHSQGLEDAPIILVEYGDYECPFCGQAYLVVKEIQKTLGDDLRFVFRNFPLAQLHPHAIDAAKAAEAASLQGKFWEMHDLLFENQERLDSEGLLSYAEWLDLDLDRFVTEADSKEVAERLSKEFEEGARTGVNSTPTFFVNGYRFDGDWRTDDLLETLGALRRRVDPAKKYNRRGERAPLR